MKLYGDPILLMLLVIATVSYEIINLNHMEQYEQSN